MVHEYDILNRDAIPIFYYDVEAAITLRLSHHDDGYDVLWISASQIPSIS